MPLKALSNDFTNVKNFPMPSPLYTDIILYNVRVVNKT